MNWPIAVSYMFAGTVWMFGIAVALKYGVMWAVLAFVFPPAAWIFLAHWILERVA